MTSDNGPHISGGNDTPDNRETPAGTTSHDPETQAESGESGHSRRRFLKGGGAGLAATVYATSAITGFAGSALGLNSKGASVVVVQGEQGKNIGSERRREAIDRVHEEAADRGRDVSRFKHGLETAEEQPSGKGPSGNGAATAQLPDEAAGGNGAGNQRTTTGDIVGFVVTVTDDGMIRGGLGRSTQRSGPGSVHGNTLARAKQLAEKNNAPVEIHKPNGKVKTLPANEIGKARRAADVRGSTAGFSSALAGSDYAKIGLQAKKYARRLEASLSGSTASTVDYADMDDLISDWDSWADDEEWGDYIVTYWGYFGDSGADTDMYGIRNKFDMIPGEFLHDNGWMNNYGNMYHNWHKGDIRPPEKGMLHDRHPYGDTDTGSTNESTTISASIEASYPPSAGASWGYSYGYSQPNMMVKDYSNRLDNYAIWQMDAEGGSKHTSTIAFKPASICEQAALTCGNSPTMLQTKEEAAFWKDDCNDTWDWLTQCDDTRESYYANWYHYAWC